MIGKLLVPKLRSLTNMELLETKLEIILQGRIGQDRDRTFAPSSEFLLTFKFQAKTTSETSQNDAKATQFYSHPNTLREYFLVFASKHRFRKESNRNRSRHCQSS